MIPIDPTFFDEPESTLEDDLHDIYKELTFNQDEDDLRRMYDEYYSCYEVTV